LFQGTVGRQSFTLKRKGVLTTTFSFLALEVVKLFFAVFARQQKRPNNDRKQGIDPHRGVGSLCVGCVLCARLIMRAVLIPSLTESTRSLLFSEVTKGRPPILGGRSLGQRWEVQVEKRFFPSSCCVCEQVHLNAVRSWLGNVFHTFCTSLVRPTPLLGWSDLVWGKKGEILRTSWLRIVTIKNQLTI